MVLASDKRVVVVEKPFEPAASLDMTDQMPAPKQSLVVLKYVMSEGQLPKFMWFHIVNHLPYLFGIYKALDKSRLYQYCWKLDDMVKLAEKRNFQQ
jgi:hypothetical protein